jgi:hypothetical protein
MKSFELNEPAVVSETIDGEAVVINLERGIYFSIRGTGLAIWTDLLSGLDVDEVAKRLAASYGSAGSNIADDARGFLDRLLQEGLLRARSATPDASASPDAAVSTGVAYEPPVLEKYTDMEALLLLDPIHDVDESGWPNRL